MHYCNIENMLVSLCVCVCVCLCEQGQEQVSAVAGTGVSAVAGTGVSAVAGTRVSAVSVERTCEAAAFPESRVATTCCMSAEKC